MKSTQGRQIVNGESFTPEAPNTQTQPTNPDILFPPNNAGRQAIVTSRPGVGFGGSPQVDNWVEAPSGGGLLISSGGSISFTSPPSGETYVLGSVGGVIQWIATEDC